MKNRLFLIDSMALIYRSYFVFQKSPRINSKKVNTSAIYGFVSTLLDILQKEQPTHLCAAFESKGNTFRHKIFDAYKAQREATPEEIIQSIQPIIEILGALRIPCISIDGYEADDVIGSMAQQYSAESHNHIYMFTPDKDYAQLVKPNVWLYRPSSRPNVQYETYNTQEVIEKFGIRPDQIADFLALKGDAVDNIPGVPKIGDKSAIDLLGKFDSLEGIYENLSKIDKKSIKETLIEHRDKAFLSKELAVIKTDLALPVTFEDLLCKEPDFGKLYQLFDEYEFITLKQRYQKHFSFSFSSTFKQKPITDSEIGTLLFEPEKKSEFIHEDDYFASHSTETKNYQTIDSEESVERLAKELSHAPVFAFDTETTSLDTLHAELVGLSFALKANEGYYVPYARLSLELKERVGQTIGAVLASSKHVKVGQNIKYDLAVLENHGFRVEEPFFDTLIAHYLCQPESKHNLEALANQYLKYRMIPIETLIGSKGKHQKSMADVPVEQITIYAAEDADITFQLYEPLSQEIKARQLTTVFEKVDLPLIPVLAEMERTGIRIDKDFLKNYSSELAQELENAEQEIYELAGTNFNINSPKQLGEILFERLKLIEKPTKTKTGQYATGEEVLEELAKQGHALPGQILNYREIAKLRSTYVDALPLLIDPETGRVHTSFNQAVAVTGRLSSNNPNLQNIPIRTEKGREIRKAFIARDENHVLMSADYSQIELRIMASLSKDPTMVEAFRQNQDIHAITAAKVFKVPLDEVTSDQRRQAKMVNFGLIYGITAFGLAQRLGIKKSEATDIVTSYFEEYPGVKAYMDNSIVKAREHGYAETLLGRKLNLPNINAGNQTIRSFAERNAINMPIQGTAADMIKLAMINIHRRIKAEKLAGKMVLQVHDELIFDVPAQEVDSFNELIRHEMAEALPLEVPVTVNIGVGNNWLDAH
jgi:DNA polymerase-1